jgi:hypothetical protein
MQRISAGMEILSLDVNFAKAHVNIGKKNSSARPPLERSHIARSPTLTQGGTFHCDDLFAYANPPGNSARRELRPYPIIIDLVHPCGTIPKLLSGRPDSPGRFMVNKQLALWTLSLAYLAFQIGASLAVVCFGEQPNHGLEVRFRWPRL